MRIRRLVVHLLVFGLAVVGIGYVDVVRPAPAHAGPLTWAVEACTNNSMRSSTDRRGASSREYECIANYRAHSNRGRLDRILADAKADKPEAVYEFHEGIAEYVAQARIIAYLHGSHTDQVAPSLQWETTMPGGAGRLDLMRYDPSSSNGVVEVLEVKGKWYKSVDESLSQAQDYMRRIREATDHNTSEMSLGGYSDTFYRGVKCDAGDPSKVDGWRYDVSAPTPGVAYIYRTPLSLDGCTVTDGGLYLGHVNGRWIAATPDGPGIVGYGPANVSVIAPDGVSTEGLLGNNNGSPADDLALVDGTQLGPAKPSDIHGRFADAWRISAAESLFTYAPGSPPRLLRIVRSRAMLSPSATSHRPRSTQPTRLA